MDPYKVLDVRPNATQQEIKKAYRELVKKYHPDKFAGTDLEEVAKEKLQEVNEAYAILMGKTSSGTGAYRSDEDSYGYNSNRNLIEQVRERINAGDYDQAEALLRNMYGRNAEWYYLNGIILWRKGWYSDAYSSLQTAVNMDPDNLEYRNALNLLHNSFNRSRQPNYSYRGVPDNRSSDCCECCTALYCADCLCECLGGDLISCC